MGSRTLNRLSASRFAKLVQPGRYCDGGGLYLQISKEGVRSWIFRFQISGHTRDMGLGSVSLIGLADAREFAGKCRRLVADGVDPIEERTRRREKQAQEAAKGVTFEDCAIKLIEAKRPSWRNQKHAAQWHSTLKAYAFPYFGDLPVNAIDTRLVLKALEPIWSSKNHTAVRVRERIEAVLDAAKVRGYRQGENPARWRGHLEVLLAKPSKVRRVKHHPALPYLDTPSFMISLRNQQSMAARAFELLILTATRTSETIFAKWEEIDLAAKTWTIPGERIKAGREHKVPLSTAAVALLQEMQKSRIGDYVFPGLRKERPLSNMALLMLLKRMNSSHITAHGFRSTFRDWAAEETNFSREVAEMALAHAIESKVEAAYRRGSLFEKRAKLMEAWAKFCNEPKGAQVILFRTA